MFYVTYFMAIAGRSKLGKIYLYNSSIYGGINRQHFHPYSLCFAQIWGKSSPQLYPTAFAIRAVIPKLSWICIVSLDSPAIIISAKCTSTEKNLNYICIGSARIADPYSSSNEPRENTVTSLVFAQMSIVHTSGHGWGEVQGAEQGLLATGVANEL